MKFKTSDGVEYEQDAHGVIHQLNPQPFKYDPSYVSVYDTEAYKRGEETLQALRYGFVCASHGRPPASILDYGCGNMAFVNFANRQTKAVGYDISCVPGAVTELRPAEVYTFWDALEHVPDLSIVKGLDCQTVVISLPWRPEAYAFDSWKHRKPNEHLHHFDATSLRLFMKSQGWDQLAISNHEDIIRKGVGSLPNILTMSFSRLRR